jgi:TRAP-type mannitol/chloroaromatic compound transport system permease small subunit
MQTSATIILIDILTDIFFQNPFTTHFLILIALFTSYRILKTNLCHCRLSKKPGGGVLEVVVVVLEKECQGFGSYI